MVRLIGLGVALCVAAQAPVLAEGAPSTPFDAAASLNESELGAVAGRADLTQVAEGDLVSVVQGNSVNGQSTTGNISIDGQAFQNLSGLAVISANSGNNVSINSSMQVNVAIRP